jgi:hypothetical protein
MEMYAHFNNIYISAYTLLICQFLYSKYFKDNYNQLFILKLGSRRGFLAQGFNGKTSLGPRDEKS